MKKTIGIWLLTFVLGILVGLMHHAFSRDLEVTFWAVIWFATKLSIIISALIGIVILALRLLGVDFD